LLLPTADPTANRWHLERWPCAQHEAVEVGDGERRITMLWCVCRAKVAPVSSELPALTVPDRAAWRAWLEEHHGDSGGVWLTLAKKGAAAPTSLSYDEALEEALCHGWIDGQLRGGDQCSYRQRFTPRGPRSGWSKRNVAIAERLIAEGRMRASGQAAVERARADGRWEAAYAGPAGIEVPAELAAALDARPAAREMFQSLSGRNRYAVLYRVATAKRAETRSRRIEQFVAMLERGETIYPQRRDRPT
jgi:uncharacterized protein YdeI (YjbR/CyaY-like superfamily)